MWLREDELHALGLRDYGRHVLIDSSCRIHGASHISVGSHVRIDFGCFISAGPQEVVIGDHVHLASGVKIFGSGGGVEIKSFAGLAASCQIFSASDNYLDGSLTGPTVPDNFRNVRAQKVLIGRHAIVGASSILLPGVTLGPGAAVGAMTLVRAPVPSGAVVAGNPLKQIGNRDVTRLLDLERTLTSQHEGEAGAS